MSFSSELLQQRSTSSSSSRLSCPRPLLRRRRRILLLRVKRRSRQQYHHRHHHHQRQKKKKRECVLWGERECCFKRWESERFGWTTHTFEQVRRLLRLLHPPCVSRRLLLLSLDCDYYYLSAHLPSSSCYYYYYYRHKSDREEETTEERVLQKSTACSLHILTLLSPPSFGRFLRFKTKRIASSRSSTDSEPSILAQQTSLLRTPPTRRVSRDRKGQLWPIFSKHFTWSGSNTGKKLKFVYLLARRIRRADFEIPPFSPSALLNRLIRVIVISRVYKH